MTTTTTTTTPTFTDEQKALAADLVETYRDAFDKASENETTIALTSGDAGLLAVYDRGLAAQPGWREITCDEITKGMRVRTVVPYEDCIDCINTYEGIAGRQEGNDWWTPGDRYLHTGSPTARIFTPCTDGLPRELDLGEAGKLPAGARFQVITTYQIGDRWEPEGDSTYRLLSLPEQPEPDPALVEIIGPEAARKVAAAGLVCEPRARL